MTSRAKVRAISTRLPHAERGAVEVVEAAQGGEEKEKRSRWPLSCRPVARSSITSLPSPLTPIKEGEPPASCPQSAQALLASRLT